MVVKVGDGVVDEWRESGVEPQVGIVVEYDSTPNIAFPYKVWWSSNESIWGYDEGEIVEMREAYEKYRL